MQSVTFPKNSMVLDKRLKSADNLAILRFIIAHEASHYILGEYEAEGTFLGIGLVEDAVVMIELVEDLGELVAVVGNA